MRQSSMFVRCIVVATTLVYLPNCNSSRGLMLLSSASSKLTQKTVSLVPRRKW